MPHLPSCQAALANRIADNAIKVERPDGLHDLRWDCSSCALNLFRRVSLAPIRAWMKIKIASCLRIAHLLAKLIIAMLLTSCTRFSTERRMCRTTAISKTFPALRSPMTIRREFRRQRTAFHFKLCSLSDLDLEVLGRFHSCHTPAIARYINGHIQYCIGVS